MVRMKRKLSHTLSTQVGNGPEKRPRISLEEENRGHQNAFKAQQYEDEDLFTDETLDYWPEDTPEANAAPLPEGDVDYFDDVPEEDLMNLSGSTSVPPFEMPPSSVLRYHDRNSRSAEEYDPNLQHSPVSTSAYPTVKESNQHLLETEVDWGPVRKYSQNVPSPMADMSNRRTHLTNTSLCTLRAIERGSGVEIPQYVQLKPFKTFLHIKDLIDAKAQMFRNSDKACFELFTRVVYTSRENFTRKQYFQFRDLLSETPPYLTGTVADWRDCPSGEPTLKYFLEKQGNKKYSAGIKCYCRCSLILDPRSDLGWAAIIRDIRPIGWKEIRLIVDRLGFTDLDRSPTAANI